MNPKGPSSQESSGMNLPPPVAEQAPLPAGAGTVPEQARGPAAAPERAPSSAAAGAAAALPVMPMPPMSDNSGASAHSAVSTTSKSTSSGLIKDEDLIDKQWVEKAKRIVERTRDDPQQQSEQLTLVKADYMKQRYGKTIKVSK
jgi:hypothetical protein